MPDTSKDPATRPDTPTGDPLPPEPRSLAADLDRALHVWESHFTGGRSPSTVGLAFADWLAHAANAPFQSASVATTALAQWQRLGRIGAGLEAKIVPLPGDHRFQDEAWGRKPYDLITQAAILGEAWWDSVVRSPEGVDPKNRRIVAFTVRQWLDLVSPSNIPWLNPEVIAATRASGGANLVKGMENLVRDATAKPGALPAGAFKVGVDVACTPGRVVFRNELFELIQYAPTTPLVGPEPVLIVPAWIMKYYILDLSPGNSLVRWLVSQGRTVFMISWRNPGADMRETSLDDYRRLGVMAAIDAVTAICGEARIHATGYCLGGTLLAITAATMARDGDKRLASLTLFAAQTDFTEAGPLELFITEDQLAFLNDVMQSKGFLDSAQMGAAFQMLRANDLVWSHAIRDYMLGQADAAFDLMAWDADGTRLPARMHIEYLRHLFLDNDLAEGRYEVDGRPLEMADLRLPIFEVATEQDHIAPWHSVWKLHLQNDGEITFVLTSGGHNAGIVSEPGHAHRHYRRRVRKAGERTLGPDEWEAGTAPREGSWWPSWGAWLAEHSKPAVPPPAMGLPGSESLGAAPGSYVREP